MVSERRPRWTRRAFLTSWIVICLKFCVSVAAHTSSSYPQFQEQQPSRIILVQMVSKHSENNYASCRIPTWASYYSLNQFWKRFRNCDTWFINKHAHTCICMHTQSGRKYILRKQSAVSYISRCHNIITIYKVIRQDSKQTKTFAVNAGDLILIIWKCSQAFYFSYSDMVTAAPSLCTPQTQMVQLSGSRDLDSWHRCACTSS